MSYICSRCMTHHYNDKQLARCEQLRREERNTRIVAGVVLVMFIAIIVGADIAWCHFVYGDWTCAFAHCRKVVP